jgi:hypothetical protein
MGDDLRLTGKPVFILFWVFMDHREDIKRLGHPVLQMWRLLFIDGRG